MIILDTEYTCPYHREHHFLANSDDSDAEYWTKQREEVYCSKCGETMLTADQLAELDEYNAEVEA